jgi:hypothetical protein
MSIYLKSNIKMKFKVIKPTKLELFDDKGGVIDYTLPAGFLIDAPNGIETRFSGGVQIRGIQINTPKGPAFINEKDIELVALSSVPKWVILVGGGIAVASIIFYFRKKIKLLFT